MRHKTQAALGIRVQDEHFQRLHDADSSSTGVYWFDLRARYPLASRAKRVIDVAVSAALIVLLAPVLLLAFVGSRFSVVRERRIGFRCHEFTIYRFSTGSSRLDGLPQLFNVLEGTMSMVGPRPLTEYELEQFPARARMRRFSVLPGITGPWRFHDGELSLDRELELDRDYVNRWSLRRDLGILLLRES